MEQDNETTYDVVIPLDVKAEFPNSCIGCGADSPTTKIKVSANAGGYINLVTPFRLGRKLPSPRPVLHAGNHTAGQRNYRKQSCC